jgi:hypothetical protein
VALGEYLPQLLLSTSNMSAAAWVLRGQKLEKYRGPHTSIYWYVPKVHELAKFKHFC